MKFKSRVACSLGCLTALLASACSPGMFFGDGVDQLVRDRPSYRKINSGCSGMDMSGPELDTATFKKLVDCFNSEGAMPEVAAFVHLLDEQGDLEPIVRAANKYLLSNRQWLYQVEQSYHGLERNQLLEPSLQELGRVLQNEAFITSSIALLKNGYFHSAGSRSRNTLLKTFELLSTKMTPELFADALENGQLIAQASAFQALQKRYTRSVTPLPEITSGLLSYLKLSRQPGHFDPIKELAMLIKNKEIYKVTGALLPSDIPGLELQVDRLASVMHVGLKDRGQLAADLSSLFKALKKPIPCMKGTQKLDKMPLSVLGQIADRPVQDAAEFVKRETVLQLVAAVPFCDLPAEVKQYYPSMIRMADSPAMEMAADLIKKLYVSRPTTQLFVDTLSDREGMGFLLPILSDTTERDSWGDLAYVASLIEIKDQDRVSRGIDFLFSERPELGGQSIYDVFADLMAQTTQEHLNAFILSLNDFVNSDEKILAPALDILRQSFHMNNVHPGIDLVKLMMSEATSNELLLNTVFRASDAPEFRNAVREFSEMAKDGRLKDLLNALVSLFHRFAADGQTTVVDMAIPKAPVGWHDLKYGKTHLGADSNGFPACSKVDLALSPEYFLKAQYKTEFDHFAACVGSGEKNRELEEAFRFLFVRGKPIAELSMDWVRDLGALHPDEIRYFGDSTLKAIEDNRVETLLKYMLFFTNTVVHGAEERFWQSGTLIEPLLDLARPIVENKPAFEGLKRLEKFGAEVLRKPGFRQQLRLLDEVLNADPQIPTNEWRPQYNREEIARVLEANECLNSAEVDVRVDQLVAHYDNALTNQIGRDLSYRESWSKEDFRKQVDPILARLSDKKTYGSVLKALLRFMAFFTLPEGQAPNPTQHYSPQDLRDFLMIRAKDPRPVTYAVHGDLQREPLRRVRLANSLDQLEILLLNADFSDFSDPDCPPDPENPPPNFAAQFLQQIGEAWGDVPFENRPLEIRKKFPKNKKQPATLRQAVDNILLIVNTLTNPEDYPDPDLAGVGLPAFPACPSVGPSPGIASSFKQSWQSRLKRVPSMTWFLTGTDVPPPGGQSEECIKRDKMKIQARIYNIKQVVSVLEENLPGSGTPYEGGMSILRDLFFSLYYSNPKGSTANNLDIAAEFVRLGAFRLMGLELRKHDAGDVSIDEFLGEIINASTSERLEPLVDALLAENLELAHAFIDEIVDATHRSDDWTRIRRTIFHLMASVKALAGDQGSKSVVDPLLETAARVMEVRENREYLKRNASGIVSILDSSRLMDPIVALYGSTNTYGKVAVGDLVRDAVQDPQRGKDLFGVLRAVDEKPEYRKVWSVFWDRLDALLSLKAYRDFDVMKAVRPMLDFLEGKETDPVADGLSRDLVWLLAQRIEKGDLDAILMVAAEDPERLTASLQSFAPYIDRGSLNQFLKAVQGYFKPH